MTVIFYYEETGTMLSLSLSLSLNVLYHVACTYQNDEHAMMMMWSLDESLLSVFKSVINFYYSTFLSQSPVITLSDLIFSATSYFMLA